MSDREDEGWGTKTTARYTLRSMVRILLDDGRNIAAFISQRDFNKVFRENPLFLEMYENILMIKFFDKVFGRINVNGEEIAIESAIFNESPRYLLPNRGNIYTLDNLQNQNITHLKSETLINSMTQNGLKACFLDNNDLIFVPFEPENGDRVLDQAELDDFFRELTPPTATPEDSADEDPAPSNDDDSGPNPDDGLLPPDIKSKLN